MSLATMVNRFVSAMIAFSFLSLSEGVTTGGAFVVFMCMSLMGIIFTYHFVPETQHKSLEEM